MKFWIKLEPVAPLATLAELQEQVKQESERQAGWRLEPNPSRDGMWWGPT